MATELRPWNKPVASAPAPQIESNFDESIKFLEQLRQNGPWVLTAIVPDGPTETSTCTDAGQVNAFLTRHNNKRNIYFSVNPTRTHMNKKAGKVDIERIEYLLSDLDPNPGETSEHAKARYLDALQHINPEPTAIIDSGNGIQCLWALLEPIITPVPETIDGKKAYTESEIAAIEQIESRSAALMTQLGSVAGTQNIDRILRLPGTVNIPNAKKLAAGRVACPTKLLAFSNNRYALEIFPDPAPTAPQQQAGNGHAEPLDPRALFAKLPAGLKKIIASPPYEGEDTSVTAASVIAQLQKLNFMDIEIIQLFKAFPNGIGRRYAEGKSIKADVERLRKKYQQDQTQARNKGFEIVNMAHIEMEGLDWLWTGHLLRGTQQLMTGTPGLGKSQVQVSFVASITAGIPWPDGQPGPASPQNVIMLTAEDPLQQIVKPRLVAAGADVSRCFVLNCIRSEGKNRQFLLGEDLDMLERAINEIGNVGLITIDPLTAFMGGKVDSHKATEVRSQLSPLKDFAERLRVTVSTITHPAKNSGGQRAIDQFIGSQAFIAACRIGHLCSYEVELDEEGNQTETGRVCFTMAKTNVYRKMPTLFYSQEVVTAGQTKAGISIDAPRVVWDTEHSDITADEVMLRSSKLPGGLSKRDDNRLSNYLAVRLQNGAVKTVDIEKEISGLGYTKRQLEHARKSLDLVARKDGLSGHWYIGLKFEL